MTKLTVPSLDLFYPDPDDELGIDRSAVSEYDRQRFFHNYEVAEELLGKYSRLYDNIIDFGSGSGYGTNVLARHRRYVFGVEPVDVAREYAKKHYQKVRYETDKENADVVVSVGSVRRFTPAELRSASSQAHTVILCAPLIQKHKTEVILTPFIEPDDAILMMKKNGFSPAEIRIECGVSFPTGDTGAYFYGVFKRD